MLRVAVVGGGPSGSCAAEVLAKAGISTWIFERKLDNAKPCGGAIPLCMVSEFDLPDSIIDRKVRNMRMISPSNREVDISLERSMEKQMTNTLACAVERLWMLSCANVRPSWERL